MGKNENTFSTRDAVCTPLEIVEPVVSILGPIGLDPCSHPNSVVPARVRYFLPEYAPGAPLGEPIQMNGFIAVVGNGLAMPWGPGLGLVYLNPPYSPLDHEPWFLRALPEDQAAHVRALSKKNSRKRLYAPTALPDECLWLVPVRTAGGWWQIDVVHVASMITFLDFRVQHVGEPHPSPFHQALVYRGPRAALWKREAEKRLGWTVPPRELLSELLRAA